MNKKVMMITTIINEYLSTLSYFFTSLNRAACWVKNSAGDILKYLGDICMKYRILFSGKKKERSNISLSSAEYALRVVKHRVELFQKN